MIAYRGCDLLRLSRDRALTRLAKTQFSGIPDARLCQEVVHKSLKPRRSLDGVDAVGVVFLADFDRAALATMPLFSIRSRVRFSKEISL